MSADAEAETRQEAEAILQRQLPMLRGYLRYLVRSSIDADDIAQDVCLTILRDPAILLRGADHGAYLRGIARHLASRHHRRTRRPPLIEDMVEAVWEAVDVTESERREALAGCLEQLTDRIRKMLGWFYADGLSSREIADRTELSADGVRMALMRARQALARCLEKKLGSPPEQQKA